MHALQIDLSVLTARKHKTFVYRPACTAPLILFGAAAWRPPRRCISPHSPIHPSSHGLKMSAVASSVSRPSALVAKSSAAARPARRSAVRVMAQQKKEQQVTIAGG
jgi:hypothetical protein